MEVGPSSKGIERIVGAVLFLDVQGYSTLTENQLRRFATTVLPELNQIVADKSPVTQNSWGDAVFAVFKAPLPAADVALELRDSFLNRNWQELEMPTLLPRISIHSGPLYIGPAGETDAHTVVGTQVTLAARVEPVTLPGQVWTTDNFVSLLGQEPCPHLKWDDLGERPLAKKWGAKRLFRLRRSHEPDELPQLDEVPAIELGEGSFSELTLCLRMLQMGTEDQKLKALDMLGSSTQPARYWDTFLVVNELNQWFDSARIRERAKALDNPTNEVGRISDSTCREDLY